MSSFIILSAKGDVKNSTLGAITEDVETALGKALKRAKAPVLIGSWSWQKYKLFLYGYKEGRTGTENKHELHAPFDETVLFGDACIVASLEKVASKPASFTSEMYKKFYNASGSFEDEGEDADIDNIDEDDEDDDDIDEDDEDYDDEGADEDGVPDDECIMNDEEEEEVRPMLRIKPSSGFKKIAKWMHSPELTPEDYIL